MCSACCGLIYVVFDADLPDEMPSLTPAPPKKSCFKASRVTFEDEDAEDRLDKHDSHISAVLSRIVVSLIKAHRMVSGYSLFCVIMQRLLLISF